MTRPRDPVLQELAREEARLADLERTKLNEWRWNNRVRRAEDAATPSSPATERLAMEMPRVERRSVDRATIHGTVSARLRHSPKIRWLKIDRKCLI